MSRLEVAVAVDAPQQLLWQVVVEVSRWPERLTSVDAVEVLDEVPLGAGAQARVTQPGMRPLTWTVTRFEPGWDFTWESTTAGVRTVGRHLVEPLGTGSRLTLVLEQAGRLQPLVRLAYGRRTAAFVRAEAAGLKAAAEGLAR